MFCRFRIAEFGRNNSDVPVLGGSRAEAQMPDKFTNLQYFPKKISRQELMGNMRGFSFSLGVRCQFCHAGKDGNKLEQMDFASDEKDTKKTARAMLRMVDAINQEYIAKMGGPHPSAWSV